MDTNKTVGNLQNPLVGEQARPTEQKDVVGFLSTSEVQQTTTKHAIQSDMLLSSLYPEEEFNHSIEDYLSRPIPVFQGLVSSSDAGFFINQFNIIDQLKSLTVFTQKLQGFYGFTATANCKILVNAQPFEQGILGLSFIPFTKYDANTILSPALNNDQSEARLPFLTGCPTRILNVGTESDVTLSIPYVGPNVFINLNNTEADWGTFNTYVISPIDSGDSSTSIDISIYLYFTDVKLFGTSLAFVPQSRDQDEKLSLEDVHYNGGECTSSEERNYDVVYPQSLVENVVGGLLGHEESGTPDLQDVLTPVLGEIARAGASGFSKPNADPNVSRLTITPFGQMQNVDGNSNAFKLGATTEQDCLITPITNDEEDEMNIKKIVSVPAYLYSIDWTTSMNSGDQVDWLGVRPDNYIWVDNDMFPTPLRFVANYFKFWRGGIRFQFHVAGTKFHSGRLRFVYRPGSTSSHSLTPTQNAAQNFLYSQIIDIRDGLSFTIDCPYISTTPWQKVPHIKNASHLDFDGDTGLHGYDYNDLLILVETPLRTTSNTSSTVRLNVFASGMDDIEFAVPNNTEWATYSDYSAKNEPTAIDHWTAPIEEEEFEDQVDDESWEELDSPKKDDFYWRCKKHWINDPCNPNDQYGDKSALCTCKTNPKEDQYYEAQGNILDMILKSKDGKEKEKEEEAKEVHPITCTCEECFEYRFEDVPIVDPQGKIEETDIAPFSMVNNKTTGSVLSNYHNQITIGEKITSLRQLIKRYSWHGTREVTEENQQFIILPYFFHGSFHYSGGTQFSDDWFLNLAPLFRFYRGGMRVLIAGGSGKSTLHYTPTLDETGRFSNNLPFFGPIQDRAWEERKSFAASISFKHDLQGGMEIQFPYYAMTPISRYSVAARSNATYDQYKEQIDRQEKPFGVGYWRTRTQDSIDIYRACADDFTMSYQIGAPACYSIHGSNIIPR